MEPLVTLSLVVAPPYFQRFGLGVAVVEVLGVPLAAMTV
jgi:hypothetical protein